jgi:hypothetical protein
VTQTPAEVTALNCALELLSQRAQSYETGVQTTVCWKTGTGWVNLLTKLDFVRKGEALPAAFAHEYREIVIVRRLLSDGEVAELVKHLVSENLLETGHRIGSLTVQVRFPIGGRTRWSHSEWSQWPTDVFMLEPPSGQSSAPDGPLIALDAPYYPSFDQVLSDFFAIRVQGYLNYFRGQVVVVLPDFRARISRLTIALAHLRADIECGTLQPTDLVVKVYAEGQIGRLVQETIYPKTRFVRLDLKDKPSFACVAVVCKATGETLHEKIFKEGVSWREPDVIVEAVEPEIEHLLLTGESETVELREKLDKSRPQRLAKTAAAFANSKGGTIVYGVDDDHHVVGCEIQGLSDTITNIIRSHCDPPPAFSTKVVNHEGKQLLLVEISESASGVHTVKDLGPFIRANGTNRSPTSHELALLYEKRQITGLGVRGLY